MSEPVIKLQNIAKSYNQRIVLNNINLEVNDNDYIAIVGKSGAGKSTLMNILGLIEFWNKGEYLLEGIPLKNYTDHSKVRLEKIGFVFQNYNLIPTLTCRENIQLPTMYTKCKSVNIEGLARELDIYHLLDTTANVLSGGEKQRVAIARALILNPKIIIADEPTGNLDDQNKNIVLNLLDMANKRGCCVILITHDHSVAKRAKNLLELKEGYLYEKN